MVDYKNRFGIEHKQLVFVDKNTVEFCTFAKKVLSLKPEELNAFHVNGCDLI